MTEPESEAESLTSDGESDDGQGVIEYKIFYPIEEEMVIPQMKIKCKGCQKKFDFKKDSGVKMADSPNIVAYYEHCLLKCPLFVHLGEMKTCSPCRLYFMNDECFKLHEPNCLKLQQPKRTGKGKGKVEAKPVRGSRSRRSEVNDGNANQEPEPENEGEMIMKELVQGQFNKLVQEERAKNAAAKKRPGPASRTANSTTAGPSSQPSTLTNGYTSGDENANTNKSSRPTPSAAAAAQVLAERKLSGKDLSQLTSALKKRSAASVKTPSALAKKKEDKKRRREERIKREKEKRTASRLSDSSSSDSSSSSEDDDDEKLKEKKKKRKPKVKDDEYRKRKEERKQKRRKKKKPFDPEKAAFRTFDTSSSELDPDEEEFPEYIHNLPDAKIQPTDYYIYIPKSSSSCPRFNDSIKCPGCQEPFACYRPHLDANAAGYRRKESEVPSPAYYKHCLRECRDYARLSIMKRCDDCCHRFLNHEAYVVHRRGGKTSQCNVLFKNKVEPLKYKFGNIARDSFLRALEVGNKKKNAKMCCLGCGTPYKCYKRGEDYTPNLVMYCHCTLECVEYKKLGLIRQCPHCKCDFMNESWLEIHECEKAPMNSGIKAKRPPLGGKTVPEPSTSTSSKPSSSSTSSKVATASTKTNSNQTTTAQSSASSGSSSITGSTKDNQPNQKRKSDDAKSNNESDAEKSQKKKKVGSSSGSGSSSSSGSDSDASSDSPSSP